jgi:hypothetical protein
MTAYWITILGGGLIFWLKDFCRRAEKVGNRSLAYYFAANFIDVLWPVALIAALFSVASIYLVHIANDPSTRVGELRWVEQKLHAMGSVKDYLPGPVLSLIIICFLSIPTLLRVPPAQIKDHPLLTFLAPLCEISLHTFGQYRRIATPLTAGLTLVSSLTFFAGAEGGTPVAVLDARIASIDRNLNDIQSAIAKRVVGHILREVEDQWPSSFPPIPYELPGAPQGSHSAKKGAPIDYYAQSVKKRYSIPLPEAAESEDLASRYHFPVESQIHWHWKNSVPSNEIWSSASGLSNQAVEDLDKTARDDQSSQNGSNDFLKTEAGHLFQEAAVEAVLSPQHLEIVRTFAEQVPMIEPLLDVVISTINDRFERKLHVATEQVVQRVVAGQANLREAANIAVGMFTMPAITISTEVKQKAARIVAHWSRLNELTKSIRSAESAEDHRIVQANQREIRDMKPIFQSLKVDKTEYMLRKYVAIIVTDMAKEQDPVRQQEIIEEVRRTIRPDVVLRYSDVRELAGKVSHQASIEMDIALPTRVRQMEKWTVFRENRAGSSGNEGRLGREAPRIPGIGR